MPENSIKKLNSIDDLSFDAIKKMSAERLNETDDEWIEMLLKDARTSVSSFGRRLLLKKQKLVDERKRLENMRLYEKKYAGMIVGGFDEAGRGPLAGPVVSAIVVLNEKTELLYLNDSKKLSAERRDSLFDEILETAEDWNIGIVDNNIIDEINILNAVHKAAAEAFNKLRKVRIEALLTDALILKGLPDSVKQESIIKGDAKSVSIAAASIIAKVTRDRIMIEESKKYPEYNFSVNKGYGTAEHINAIKKYGLCPIHRKTFCRSFVN